MGGDIQRDGEGMEEKRKRINIHPTSGPLKHFSGGCDHVTLLLRQHECHYLQHESTL